MEDVIGLDALGLLQVRLMLEAGQAASPAMRVEELRGLIVLLYQVEVLAVVAVHPAAKRRFDLGLVWVDLVCVGLVLGLEAVGLGLVESGQGGVQGIDLGEVGVDLGVELVLLEIGSDLLWVDLVFVGDGLNLGMGSVQADLSLVVAMEVDSRAAVSDLGWVVDSGAGGIDLGLLGIDLLLLGGGLDFVSLVGRPFWL